jgi:hypothetical protein
MTSYFAVVDRSSLDILYTYAAEESQHSKFEGAWGDPALCVHVQVPGGLDVNQLKARLRANGTISIELDTNKAPTPAMALTALRAERNQRLAASDWTQLPDVTLSDEAKLAYRAYRQALRDFPSSTTDPLNPEWPVEPKSVSNA